MQAYRRNGGESSREGRCTRVTVDMLPDVALLKIFDFYVDRAWIEEWYTLVHVCRMWRNVVFGSPRRLNLQLFCTPRTPVRKIIDAWPLLPIVVFGGNAKGGADNIIAALEHNDRICQVDLSDSPSSDVDKVLAALQQPFPALKDLWLNSSGETAPVVPASFLGGSAPQLQSLDLGYIPFPGLPKLLLSATHLVNLYLRAIPHSGYISPEAMVTGLAALTSLEILVIGFESPRSHPDRKNRRPPPLTRNLLPALKDLWLKGASEYLDDLVAQIDAPLLDKLEISFFYQLIFDTPQLTQFISRTPKFKAYDEARVKFSDFRVRVTTTDGAFRLGISCRPSDWQLSSLAQVCSSVFMPAVVRLYILQEPGLPLYWQGDIETSQWLEVLHPLTAVEDLYISRAFTRHIAPTLQELVGGRVTEVLPALQTLFLQEMEPVEKGIGKFVAARELAGRPIAVSRWNVY